LAEEINGPDQQSDNNNFDKKMQKKVKILYGLEL
jgi:hypothetical protein